MAAHKQQITLRDEGVRNAVIETFQHTMNVSEVARANGLTVVALHTYLRNHKKFKAECERSMAIYRRSTAQLAVDVLRDHLLKVLNGEIEPNATLVKAGLTYDSHDDWLMVKQKVEHSGGVTVQQALDEAERDLKMYDERKPVIAVSPDSIVTTTVPALEIGDNEVE